jgi:transposase
LGPRQHDARGRERSFLFSTQNNYPGATGLDNNTTLLLDLDGLAVVRGERLENCSRRVHLVTADEGARACPACGVLSSCIKGSAVTRPRDLPCGERDWSWCGASAAGTAPEPQCPRRTFTERQIPSGARITERLRSTAGQRVRDADPLTSGPRATCGCPRQP